MSEEVWTVGDEVSLFALAEGIDVQPWQMRFLSHAMPEVCPQAPDCQNGWIECWSPGGACSPPNSPGCENCGPCNICNEGPTA